MAIRKAGNKSLAVRTAIDYAKHMIKTPSVRRRVERKVREETHHKLGRMRQIEGKPFKGAEKIPSRLGKPDEKIGVQYLDHPPCEQGTGRRKPMIVAALSHGPNSEVLEAPFRGRLLRRVGRKQYGEPALLPRTSKSWS